MISTRESIDRAAADGKLSAGDAATLHAFADLLSGTHSGCANCLAPATDHRHAAQCPDISDAERRKYGVTRLDVAYARVRDGRIRACPR